MAATLDGLVELWERVIVAVSDVLRDDLVLRAREQHDRNRCCGTRKSTPGRRRAVRVGEDFVGRWTYGTKIAKPPTRLGRSAADPNPEEQGA
jgi:hypothetical protein